MKRFAVVLCAVFALVVGLSSVASASAVNRVRVLKHYTNWGTATAPDSVSGFTIEVGTANACTDTIGPVFIGDTNYQPSPAGSTNIGAMRLVIHGTASNANADTLYAYPEFANSPDGPWYGAGASVVPPLTLLAATGAGGTTTASGQAVFSSEVPNIATSTFTGVSPRYWLYARFRINGDHSSGAIITNSNARLVVPVDDAPGNVDRN